MRVTSASRSVSRVISFVSASTQKSNGRPPSGVIVTTSYLRPSSSVRSFQAIFARARSGYQNARRSR